jgi:hypothetical protein
MAHEKINFSMNASYMQRVFSSAGSTVGGKMPRKLPDGNKILTSCIDVIKFLCDCVSLD